MSRRVQFSTLPTREKRIHYVDADDVRVVLSRLPDEVKARLLTVKFNDRSRGARTLGYVNRGRREIALCALPPRVSLTRSLVRGQSPRQFGATRGEQWSSLAVRRFMLYDVLLHELGHLQIIHERANSVRRKFAMETRAEEFATKWRKQLWAKPFDHPDPAHNPPTAAEFTDPDPELSHLVLRTQQRPNDVNLLQKLERLYLKRRKYQDAKEALDKAIAINPRNPWTNLHLGNWYYFREQFTEAINPTTLPSSRGDAAAERRYADANGS